MKLWLPKSQTEYQVLWPQPAIPVDQNIPAQEKGFIDFNTPELPLTYTAVEVTTSQGTLWSYLRIKREQFDISGGWVFDSKGKWQEATETDAVTGKTINRFLDLLTSMHINTAHYENAAAIVTIHNSSNAIHSSVLPNFGLPIHGNNQIRFPKSMLLSF